MAVLIQKDLQFKKPMMTKKQNDYEEDYGIIGTFV